MEGAAGSGSFSSGSTKKGGRGLLSAGIEQIKRPIFRSTESRVSGNEWSFSELKKWKEDGRGHFEVRRKWHWG